MRTLSRTLLASLLLLCLHSRAEAHALGAEAKLKEGRVHVDCYFDDDTPAADARVKVENEAKALVAEGRTDNKGHWSFAAPEPGLYRVTVDAGGGHRATVRVTIPGPQGGTPSEVVSEGPSREGFTRFPWERLAAGLALIALLAVVVPRLARSRRQRKEAESTPEKGEGSPR